MKKLLTRLALAATLLLSSTAFAQDDQPTIVLVHGAFAEASSWNSVVANLRKQGYPVVAVANPLRGVANDAKYVGDIVASLKTPVVLVGHSYGGLVIGEVGAPAGKVKALVFVAAFAADRGETAVALSGKFPGSTLGNALAAPVALSSGGNDLYIRQDKFHDQFAADVPAADAALMAATQRPITEAALNEAATEPNWKRIPSWFVYGGRDKNIPPASLAFMAKRAKSKRTVAIPDASHVVMVSHPDAVAELIVAAAQSK